MRCKNSACSRVQPRPGKTQAEEAWKIEITDYLF